MPALPSAKKPAAFNWIASTLSIPVTRADGTAGVRAVQVQRLGVLAVHSGFSIGRSADCWDITSVTTGKSLCWVKLEADARRVAETLYRDQAAKLALQQSEPSEICRRLPSWVVPWCLKCAEVGAWVDPKEYQK